MTASLSLNLNTNLIVLIEFLPPCLSLDGYTKSDASYKDRRVLPSVNFSVIYMKKIHLFGKKTSNDSYI